MLSGSLGKYMDLMRPDNPNVEWMGIAYPAGPDGKSYTDVAPPGPQTYGSTVITSACKYPAEALRWIDYHFSPEGQMFTNFGVEGESYVYAEGKPTLTDAVLREPGGLPVTSAVCKYSTLSISFISCFRGDAWAQALIYPQQLDSIDIWSDSYNPSLVMPKISLTPEESDQISTIVADAGRFESEMRNKIIMGLESIDKYEEIVKTLNDMKISNAIGVYQNALVRYNSR
jgi:putative aldouronate transport system substrate-binding protein